MAYVIFGIGYFLLQSLLIAGTRINVFPEMFFLPWLVSKGLLPYRDFFDHHGFLLYYMLAPLTIERSLVFIKLFYFFTQSLNLFLVLMILKKVSSRSGFLLGGLLFVFMNFFVSDNVIWYDTFITAFFLSSFLLFYSKTKYKHHLSGLFITLASFIKPVAGIMILPVVFFSRTIIPFGWIIGGWFVVGFFFAINHGLTQLIDQLFFFNRFLVQYYRNPFFSDQKFLISVSIMVLLSVVILAFSGKLKKILLTFSFLFLSIVFVFYLYNKQHLIELSAFSVILIGQTMKDVKKWGRIFFVIIILFCVIMGRKAFFQRTYLNHYQQAWIENTETAKIISSLRKNHLDTKRIFVFGRHVEIYYMLNLLPPTKYPLLFPLIENYDPNLEIKLINGLRDNNIGTIVVPLPLDKQFKTLSKVINYIHQDYIASIKNKDFEVFIKRK